MRKKREAKLEALAKRLGKQNYPASYEALLENYITDKEIEKRYE